MLNTMETIILVLLTVALIISAPLMIAQGVVNIVSDVASKAWENFNNFANWLHDSIDKVIFGGGTGNTTPTGTNTTTNTTTRGPH